MEVSYKIVLLGDGGVGKSTWIRKWISGEFEKKYIATLGVEVHPLRFKTNHGYIKLDFWDVAGQEKFGGLCDGYYISADAAIVFCDVNNKLTLENVSKWMIDFKRTCPEKPIMMVINKFDVPEWKRNFAAVKQLTEHLDIPTVMISVKSGQGMSNGITKLIQMLISDDIKLLNDSPKYMGKPRPDLPLPKHELKQKFSDEFEDNIKNGKNLFNHKDSVINIIMDLVGTAE